jgi:cytochrome c556
MKMMCNSFENKNFRDLGFAFHESGDALGDALQAHDTDAALRALQATLGYCVQCHAAFRQ